MSALADKIRKARQFSKEVAGWKLTLRRPTDEEAATLFRDDLSPIDIAKRFVIGWAGVNEQDIVSGGSDQPAQFDADTWAAVIEDRPEMWQPITTAVVEAWSAHNDEREARAKN
jgi:hypothetical protein